MATPSSFVAEMQGLYGPFTLAERVVQKIWLQLDFASHALQLVDGRRLEVLHPGRWNLLGGPDFHGARLRIDGRDVTGDIEVHFRAGDWRAHGHDENPAYDNVVLHVLLFPPHDARESRTRRGVVIPELVLLPLLHRDLEEYAADDALEALTAQDESRRVAELLNRPVEEVRAALRRGARGRWERKVHHARQRVARLGWEAAAHHTALEILGYRHNRVPMLAVAERWPIDAWRAGGVAATAAAWPANWQRHGMRPANRPEARLAQYEEWCRRCPDWPTRLLAWADALGGDPGAWDGETSAVRRTGGFGAARERAWNDVAGRAVSAARFHTLVSDGWLPLAAAQGDRDLGGVWFHWFVGDLPKQVRRVLGGLGVIGAPLQPWCNGWGQGMLAWLIDRAGRT